MKKKHDNLGFSMLEVSLAIIIIVVAGMGAYELFSSGLKSNNITDAEDEAVQIANVYTDLASSDLTSNVATVGIETLLQNSGRLSAKYFSGSPVQLNNAFGALDFSVETPTPYSFAVAIPLGCVPADSSLPEQFFKKVQDQYSCTAGGSKDFADCSPVLPCKESVHSSLTLYFNMNH